MGSAEVQTQRHAGKRSLHGMHERITLKFRFQGQALVAYACHPSYSGGRDQKDHGFKPARANSSMRPSLSRKNPLLKRAIGVAQGVGPEFKPQYHKNK
jgi:hypothetical protein